MAIGQWSANAPQHALARLGARAVGALGVHVAPSAATIRRVIALACPGGLADLTGSDLAGSDSVAVDGKAARGSRRGQLVVTPLRRQAMPLLRYNLEDIVEISHEDCPCGWKLPLIDVYGRAAFTHRVRDAEFTQHDLEELVFSLPDQHDVLFWRARANPQQVEIQIEAAPEHAADACALLRESAETRLGLTASVDAVAPGTLVPPAMLTTSPDVVKPKSLFAAHEDWDRAVLYC
ncbi:hypothetical protein KNE206_57510 [Kitasatospora sp. NE20-6]|uniref:hypothetical protein n=1 Tax=Kitasatospora sp. NE20-6 TaxID=2859066 RepID=UPI0034DCA19B